jgi:hypothetical protein
MPRNRPGPARPVVAAAAAALALLVAGCGGSDKPAYCSDRSDLEASVKSLGNVSELTSGGLSGLQSKLSKVDSDARKLVDSAKSDFPSETDAISSSVSKLDSSVRGLPSNPSAAQLTAVGVNVKAVATSVSDFTQATSSKCS